MKTYNVTISVTGYEIVQVRADDEEDAEQLALDNMDVAKLQVTEQYAHTIEELT